MKRILCMIMLTACETDYTKPFHASAELYGCAGETSEDDLKNKTTELVIGNARTICMSNEFSGTKVVKGTLVCTLWTERLLCANNRLRYEMVCKANFTCVK